MICVVVTLASVQGRAGAKLVFSANHESTIEKVFADSGYSGPNLANWVQEHHGQDLEIVKRPQGKFEVVSMRWIVERTFGWLNRYRLLAKEYERTFESSTADIEIAMTSTMLRRLTKPPAPQYENLHLLAHLT